jgi:hypothetical protein
MSLFRFFTSPFLWLGYLTGCTIMLACKSHGPARACFISAAVLAFVAAIIYSGEDA